MRWILLLSFITLLQPMSRKEPFAVVSAEAEPFYAGRAEGGKGTRLELEVVTYRSSNKLSFEYLIIQAKMVPFMMRNKSRDSQGFQKNDTLQLVSNFNETIDYDVYPMNRSGAEDEFSRLVWLSFSFKGRPGLKEVEKFSEGEVKIYE